MFSGLTVVIRGSWSAESSFMALQVHRVREHALQMRARWDPTSFIWKRWDYIHELEGGQARWGTELLLLFSKVWMVAIIYQIVQAFRKFERR